MRRGQGRQEPFGSRVLNVINRAAFEPGERRSFDNKPALKSCDEVGKRLERGETLLSPLAQAQSHVTEKPSSVCRKSCKIKSFPVYFSTPRLGGALELSLAVFSNYEIAFAHTCIKLAPPF